MCNLSLASFVHNSSSDERRIFFDHEIIATSLKSRVVTVVLCDGNRLQNDHINGNFNDHIFWGYTLKFRPKK
jgi:hypothetical protein